MRETMRHLLAAALLFPVSASCQTPAPVPLSFKGAITNTALDFRELTLNDSSKIDLCGISRILEHDEATIQRVIERTGAARFRGATGANCVPLVPGRGDSVTSLAVERFEFVPGISDSLARSYNLDRNPDHRAGLASLTLIPFGGPGMGHGHRETYTFAIMQDRPGGTHVFWFFLYVTFHHFGQE
jgi:hypothetical protein